LCALFFIKFYILVKLFTDLVELSFLLSCLISTWNFLFQLPAFLVDASVLTICWLEPLTDVTRVEVVLVGKSVELEESFEVELLEESVEVGLPEENVVLLTSGVFG